MMADMIDISSRCYEDAFSALMEVLSRYKAMGVLNRQIGQIMIASSLPYLWKTDHLDDLRRAALEVVSQEMENFSRSIGASEIEQRSARG